MEKNFTMRREYTPSGVSVDRDGSWKEGIGQALTQGGNVSGGPGLVRLSPLSEERKSFLKRLWQTFFLMPK